MRANEFIPEEIVDELAPKFVNKTIKKQGTWKSPTGKKKPPRGLTASVWQHMAEPDTVVKVVGGGRRAMLPSDKAATIAFVNFLVDYGKSSPHFPICYGVQTDMSDPEEPVQVRLEKLLPLPLSGRIVGWELESIAEFPGSSDAIRDLQRALNGSIVNGVSLGEINNAQNIANAVRLLNKKAPYYQRKYKLQELFNDLHSDNWMLTPKGVVVMSDPWFGGR